MTEHEQRWKDMSEQLDREYRASWIAFVIYILIIVAIICALCWFG